ncbi:MAG: TrbC/VirB2 family protein [Rickettsiales bacterium]
MKTTNLSTAWQMSLMIMLSVIVVMLPDMAFAAVATPIGNAMCTVAAWFLGNTGQGLATLAIIVIGVGALMGKVSWGMAIIVGLGIALIFGAAAMVTSIGAGGSGCQ